MAEVSYDFMGERVRFCVGEERSDPFSVRIRQSWKPDTHTLVAAQILRPEDIFLDLGANYGAFCIPVAKKTGARGYAVEALISNIPILHDSIIANDLQGKLEWILGAITDHDGEVRIAGASAYGTVGDKGHRVLSYSLDGLVEDFQIKNVHVVKMDIEGCEMDALAGADAFFKDNPSVTFIFEANAAHCISRGYAPQDLIRYFEEKDRIIYLAKGGHLVRRSSLDFQESGVSDYIASPYPLEGVVDGFKFEDFSNDFRISETIRALSVMKPGYGQAAAAQIAFAPDFIRNHAEIVKFVDEVRARQASHL